MTHLSILSYKQGDTAFNLAISKQHMSILQMLEEHSGGNYPFPRLDPMRTTNENNRNENTSSIFLRQSKYLSNSADSLNMMKQSPNIIEPSRYYHVEEQHHGIHRYVI